SMSHSASWVPTKSKAPMACLSANRCSARQLPFRLAAISSALAWMREFFRAAEPVREFGVRS
ncbi:hypothetical protein, partial [Roseateles oligotrophus]|uniref:hypothetical protein n=1 Tax=Roseateles oligotrophus TaxID=1769250 RepID=UPI001C8847F8